MPGMVDSIAEAFADIICADPEWVDGEFWAIVGGSGDIPAASDASLPGRSRGVVGVHETGLPDARGALRRADSPIRSPPFRGVKPQREKPKHTVRNAQSSGKEEFHHVDVI